MRKTICDYCEKEINSGQHVYNVMLANDKTDVTAVDREACSSCADILKRLLKKSGERLRRAVEASSDR